VFDEALLPSTFTEANQVHYHVQDASYWTRVLAELMLPDPIVAAA
jgi:hypothetical protein